MPKKKVSASTDVRSPAAALIAKAQASTHTTIAVPSDVALAELRKVLAHNDARGVSSRGRVSREAAIEMLKALGWTGSGRSALDALCRAQLGRRSYGTP
jgi:hypothetical protein